MPPINACSEPAELNCNQKKALELSKAEDLFTKICSDGGASIPDLLQLFFKPPHVTDPGDQQAALVNYLTRHEICRPSNNAGTDCVEDEPCLDPQPTFCPDPDECPSKFYGYGLLELIKSAIRADSMVYIPVKGLNLIANGEPLVWDSTVAPDNSDCDPCAEPVLGAFRPQHIYEAAHP